MDKEMVIAYVKDRFTRVDSDWTLNRAEGSYSGLEIDERWTREYHITFVEEETYKETVRFVRYGNMKDPDVNVQWHIYRLTKEGWKHVFGHDRTVMPIDEARVKFLKSDSDITDLFEE